MGFEKNKIYYKKYYLVFIIFIGMVFSGCQAEFSHANKGITNINVQHIRKGFKIELSGEWEFYWQKLLTPDSFLVSKPQNTQFVKNPRSWTSFYDQQKQNYPAHGFATYRLQMALNDTISELGFVIPKIWSANKIWINGKLVSQRGKVAKNFQDYENEILENIVKYDFEKNIKHIEIVVQVANYDIFIAGIIQNFFVGNYKSLIKNKNLSNVMDIAWLGFLYFMVIYHFILWIFHKDKSTLIFGIICLIIATRILVFGEHYLYQYLKETNNLAYEWQSKAYFVTSFLLLPIALMYIETLYGKYANKRIIYGIFWILATYCIFILLTPPYIFTQTINVFEIVTFFAQLYLIYILILANFFQKDGDKNSKSTFSDAKLQLFAIIFMIVASINDSLHAEEINLLGFVELVPTAFAFLIGLQIVIIARRFSQAFNDVEELSINLEKRVLARTQELQEANNEIINKKNEIEEKSKNISESIAYAERIQRAILPLDEHIKSFIPHYFVLFQPRDVVSGDFYYIEKINQKIVVASVDCTGHGIPGALMSMLGKDILDNIIIEKEITEPDKILNELHKGIRAVLRQQEGKNKDGMDISIICIDILEKNVSFAGAKNPIIYVQNNEVKEIKANRFSIGGEQQEKERIFDKHTIPFSELASDTIFYMFSDGYQDQFGGAQNKKFMISNMKKLFLEIYTKDTQTQKEILQNTIKNWIKEGDEKQIDDILVMGVKIIVNG